MRLGLTDMAWRVNPRHIAASRGKSRYWGKVRYYWYLDAAGCCTSRRLLFLCSGCILNVVAAHDAVALLPPVCFCERCKCAERRAVVTGHRGLAVAGSMCFASSSLALRVALTLTAWSDTRRCSWWPTTAVSSPVPEPCRGLHGFHDETLGILRRIECSIFAIVPGFRVSLVADEFALE